MTPAGYECLRLAPSTQMVLPLMLGHQCGQAFRWRAVATRCLPDGQVHIEWSLCLPHRVVFLIHDPVQHCLYHRTVYAQDQKTQITTEEWLRDYLNLSVPIEEWYKDWCTRDPIFAKHARRFAGVHMLRQDPWECLCAYV
ncbi:8-oxoguanine glycosylase Ogg1 [Malassezia pachydermatis]